MGGLVVRIALLGLQLRELLLIAIVVIAQLENMIQLVLVNLAQVGRVIQQLEDLATIA